MSTYIQQLTVPEHSSFTAQKVKTNWFEIGMHQHSAYEIIFLTEGSGIVYIGNYANKFEAGEIYFIGSNLPHAFQKNDNESVSAIVVQFCDNCMGSEFFTIPECRDIKGLLDIATHGLLFIGKTSNQLRVYLKALENTPALNRILLFLQCLQLIVSEREYVILSKKKETIIPFSDKQGVDKVFAYTLAFFYEPITLSKAASVACMSIPSFCVHFKRHTHKTYIDFLNDVRINHACYELEETQKPITNIGYDCGYNSTVHFHRQFLKRIKLTPLQYRKQTSIKTNVTSHKL